MSRKANIILSFFLLTILVLSCKKADVNPNKVLWGETNYYKNFLFYKYDTVIMTQTLEFEFNEDAKRFITQDILFELVEKDENGKFLPAEGICLYKNGVKCDNNILKITINDDTADIGIEFTDKAYEGNHTLYLCVKNTGGLDRIDNIDLSSGGTAILTHEWVVKKDDDFNPLAEGLFWALVFIVAFLIVWRIVLRPMFFETFKVRKLFFFYPDAPMKTVNLKGVRKVICSKRKQSQSFFSNFFTGKIAFVQNSFWEQDAEVTPRNKNSVRIRISKGSMVLPSSIIEKGTDMEVKNKDKSIKLQIQ